MQTAAWGEIRPQEGHLCLGRLRQPLDGDLYPSSIWTIIIAYTIDKYHDMARPVHTGRAIALYGTQQLLDDIEEAKNGIEGRQSPALPAERRK